MYGDATKKLVIIQAHRVYGDATKKLVAREVALLIAPPHTLTLVLPPSKKPPEAVNYRAHGPAAGANGP